MSIGVTQTLKHSCHPKFVSEPILLHRTLAHHVVRDVRAWSNMLDEVRSFLGVIDGRAGRSVRTQWRNVSGRIRFEACELVNLDRRARTVDVRMSRKLGEELVDVEKARRVGKLVVEVVQGGNLLASVVLQVGKGRGMLNECVESVVEIEEVLVVEKDRIRASPLVREEVRKLREQST